MKTITFTVTDEQYATYQAFRTFYDAERVTLREGEPFTFCVDMQQYDMVADHAPDEDGWCEPPFDNWEIPEDGGPFEVREVDYGQGFVRARRSDG